MIFYSHLIRKIIHVYFSQFFFTQFLIIKYNYLEILLIKYLISLPITLCITKCVVFMHYVEVWEHNL